MAVRQKTTEYSRIIAIFVTFPCPHALWQEKQGVFVFSPNRIMFVTTGCRCLQNLLFYSSFGFLSGLRPKSPQDLWAELWLSVRSVAFSVTHGSRWDLWLTVWPEAVSGTVAVVLAVALSGTCGCQWHPWQLAWPMDVSGTCGC